MAKGYATIKTAYIEGASVEIGLVEIDITPGLPNLTVVGLPDRSVKEAKERIRSALLNAGYDFPRKRITVNLSPGGTKKEGTHFDLPIAVGILVSSGQIKVPLDLHKIAFIGELALDGKINDVHSAMALTIGMEQKDIEKICLPATCGSKTSFLRKAEIISMNHVKDIELVMRGQRPKIETPGATDESKRKKQQIDYHEVLGQEDAKRSMEVAAAGFHNLLMIGPPGSGKTMLARRLPGIMPTMSYEEALELTKIKSLAGHNTSLGGLEVERPFRAPHHSITPVALVGGGAKGRPGELSLAHNGILFLDEFPEFQRRALEVLRQPMEDEFVTISRALVNIKYPAKFMMIAAMNPCPCGYFGHHKVKCKCSEHSINRYISGVSGPLADRIDMFLEIYPPPYSKISKAKRGLTSEQMKKRVEEAVKIQRARYEKEGIFSNSQLTPALIDKYCGLSKESHDLLKTAHSAYNLSARAHQKIIKLARTIADLAGSKEIQPYHIAEAISYNKGFILFE